MSRFFIEKDQIFSDHVVITGEDVKHIRNVLRLSQGDIVTVCDGAGTDYSVRIAEMDPARVKAEILQSAPNRNEPPIEVTLYQGLPKSDKMELIIQKGVELGVTSVVPVYTERTVVKLESRKDEERKTERWQRIAFEASKQCNRGIVPKIGMPVAFKKALELSAADHLRIIPYEKEAVHRLKSCIPANNIEKAAIFIGPEGGFSDKEIETAEALGVLPVTLGPRILRTETAGMAVLAIIMYEIGDIG